MDLQHYPVIKLNSFCFTFKSTGPKGEVDKVIIYSLYPLDGMTVFNLSFGDETQDYQINDSVVTNNGDRELVLSTVAWTILDVTEQHPDIPVRAKGATSARTRLYQMGIAKNIDKIEKFLAISGKHHGKWIAFKTGVNFTEFLAKRKTQNYETSKGKTVQDSK